MLCEYVDWRPVPHHRVDILNLAVRHRDATRRPVWFDRVDTGSWPAMDENVAARLTSLCSGIGDIGLVRIGDADGEMEQTVGIAAVDCIGSLGRFSITLELLGPLRRKTEIDPVGFQDRGIVEQEQVPVTFEHLQPGDCGPVVGPELAGASRKAECQSTQ